MSSNPFINSIKVHAETLRATDEKQYNAMFGELASIGQSEYFRQTLCRNGNEDYDLRKVRASVANIMCKYLNFSESNFLDNKLPELPNLTNAA